MREAVPAWLEVAFRVAGWEGRRWRLRFGWEIALWRAHLTWR